MNQNLLKAIVRSITPWVLASVVWLIQHLGFHASTVQSDRVLGVLGVLITIGAHTLETKWKWFGVFLGWIGAPKYDPSVTKAQLQSQVATLTSQLDAINAVISPAPGAPVA